MKKKKSKNKEKKGTVIAFPSYLSILSLDGNVFHREKYLRHATILTTTTTTSILNPNHFIYPRFAGSWGGGGKRKVKLMNGVSGGGTIRHDFLRQIDDEENSTSNEKPRKKFSLQESKVNHVTGGHALKFSRKRNFHHQVENCLVFRKGKFFQL